MLELAHRLSVTPPRRLAVFPGAFNPPTHAHLAMAEAALSAADEVLFVLPREFPHKAFEGPGFDERVAMISAVAARDPRFSVGATPRGLFIEIAEACRAVFGDATKLLFLCGSDAAERIVNWNYDPDVSIGRQLEQYELLVAARGQDYTPPESFRTRIHRLALGQDFAHVSSTAVRERLLRGESWRDLVPEETAPLIEALLPRWRRP